MKKNKRKPARKPKRHNVAVLDVFTEWDLEHWETRATDFQKYHDRVYFDLERQRAAQHDNLCAALRAAPVTSIVVDGWTRVTDYRWSLTPLSPAGSIKGIGHRFNIGQDLDRARGQEFPCLYIAQDIDTAYREHFGGALDMSEGKLTLSEFALRRPTSFTTFLLNGCIEHALDLRNDESLSAFAAIIAKFDVSSDTRKFARRHGVAPRTLIKNVTTLRERLLDSPHRWRMEPQMWGIPAASQIFGRFASDAGLEGLLYPSQRGGALCLALFPQNFEGSSSTLEVVGDVPEGATCTVLDKNHLCLDGID